MARFPCDATGHAYRGPQNTAYLGIIRASAREGKRLRLCSEHLDELRNTANLTEMGGDAAPLEGMWNICDACHEEMDEGSRYAVFSTEYAAGHERVDLFAQLCRHCMTKLALAFTIPLP